jgi:hypothetical protein
MYRINVKPHLYIFLVACNDRQNNCKLTDLLENDLASLDKKKCFNQSHHRQDMATAFSRKLVIEMAKNGKTQLSSQKIESFISFST